LSIGGRRRERPARECVRQAARPDDAALPRRVRARRMRRGSGGTHQ
jgi:hypothetical protein